MTRWFIGKEMKVVLGAEETVLGLRILPGGGGACL